MGITVTRGNQKINIPEKRLKEFEARGWQAPSSSNTSPSTTSKSNIKEASAVVTPTPIVKSKPVQAEVTPDEELEQLIEDGYNKEEEE